MNICKASWNSITQSKNSYAQPFKLTKASFLILGFLLFPQVTHENTKTIPQEDQEILQNHKTETAVQQSKLFRPQILQQEIFRITPGPITSHIETSQEFIYPLPLELFPIHFQLTPTGHNKEYILQFYTILRIENAYFYHCIVYNEEMKIVKSNSYPYKNKPVNSLVNFNDLEEGVYTLELRFNGLKRVVTLKL